MREMCVWMFSCLVNTEREREMDNDTIKAAHGPSCPAVRSVSVVDEQDNGYNK